MDPNIDARIRFKLLPPSTIIKNFVKGEPDCNYEKYLLELLNASKYFRKMSISKFCAPVTESNGECDAISENYEIDFKLLASTTRLQASSQLSNRITKMSPGVILHHAAQNINGEIKQLRFIRSFVLKQ
ncbi:hypothetical protein [Lactococcus lactis]|uniref:hypothetical protein n=1 Tax=Lactococcus lactis TaxID=1358 RepID=UPI0022E06914|nr:hypothetical protein [Lactococcus lactis]